MNFSDEVVTINKSMKIANLVRCVEQENLPNFNDSENHNNNVCFNINAPTPLPDFDHADLSWSPDIDLSHLSPDLKIKIEDFLNDYKDVFAQSVLDLPGCATIPHEIHLTDSKPVKSKMYRVPFHLRKELEDQIDILVKANILFPSMSEYASPVILVKKPSNSYRLCCDFRRLNLKLVKDAYPIPNLTDSVDTLTGSNFFSSLDLTSGFFQQTIRPQDRHKTAIITHKGLFEWSRNCFGLSNSGPSFQRLMSYIFGDLSNNGIQVYIDDILISSKTVDSHLEKLKIVFNRLREHKLKLKPSKCKFLSTKITYLGFEIESGKMYPINRNISTVENFKVPNSRKTVRSFIGCISFYRKFIPDFSLRAKNLINLTKENGKFVWTPEAQMEFEDLKNALISKPCLALPNFDKEFQLYTDASGGALGAVITQLDDNNFPHPVSFASRKLKSPEVSYSTTEREILALVWATNHFKCYLANKHFTIYTDHAPLKFMLKIKDPTSRMARWICTLSDFDFTTLYIRGKCNGVADFLSRFIEDPTIGEEINGDLVFALQHSTMQTTFLLDNALLNKIKLLQKEDPKCCSIAQRIVDNAPIAPSYMKFKFEEDLLICEDTRKDNIIGNPIKVLVPKSLVLEIFSLTHESSTACHQGFHKTIDRIREYFYWPGMSAHIKNLIDSCEKCQKRRAHKANQLAPLQRLPTPESPMSTIHLDCLGPFPMSISGNKYVVSYIDSFSKWPEAYAVPSIEADKIAETLADFISRYGTPSKIITDKGRNLIADALDLVYKKLNIKRSVTSSYHPSSNAQVERLHATLVNALSYLVNDFHDNWDNQLKYALLAIRSSVHNSTKFTPAAVLYGRNMNLPYSVLQQTPVFSYNDAPSYCEQLIPSLQNVYTTVKNNLIKVAEQQEAYRLKTAVDKNIQVGDLVWLYTPIIKPNQCKKLSTFNSGPFTVIKKIGNVNFIIAQNDNLTKTQKVHVDRLTKATPRMEFPNLESESTNPKVNKVPTNAIPLKETFTDANGEYLRSDNQGRNHKRRAYVAVNRRSETGCEGKSGVCQAVDRVNNDQTSNQPTISDINKQTIRGRSKTKTVRQIHEQSSDRYTLRRVPSRSNR